MDLTNYLKIQTQAFLKFKRTWLIYQCSLVLSPGSDGSWYVTSRWSREEWW
jgi:hypothetical protein